MSKKPYWKNKNNLCIKCNKIISNISKYCDSCHKIGKTKNKANNWQGGKEKRYCKICEEPFYVFPYRKKVFCSYQCSGKTKGYFTSSNMIGENNPNWKGGISVNVHSIREPKYKKWRSDVFTRDNWTCQTCRKRGGYLEAHHIKSWAKYPKLRYDLENGITLCMECHKLTDNYRGKK